MTRSTTFLAIIVALSASVSQSAQLEFSQLEAAEIFKKYDVDEVDAPDCREEDSFHELYCPKNDKVCCDKIPEITAHCTDVLGILALDGLPTNTGVNALEGCVRYVGYHIFEDKHLACCPSDVCNEWIEEQFKRQFHGDDDDETDETDETDESDDDRFDDDDDDDDDAYFADKEYDDDDDNMDDNDEF